MAGIAFLALDFLARLMSTSPGARLYLESYSVLIHRLKSALAEKSSKKIDF
jgi:hypothetical protein